MAPDYKKLGEATEGKDYVIAKVDATQATKTAEKAGVSGYPTLKFIVDGVALDFSGERNFESMRSWLDDTMSSSIPSITEDKVKELIGSTDFVLIQGASSDQLKVLRFAVTKGGVSFYSIEGS